MENKLTIGILNKSLAWESILYQAGVSFAVLNQNADISPHQYSLLIINRPVSPTELDKIKEYVSNGGAIIDEGYCIDTLMGGTFKKKKVSYLFANELPFNQSLGIIDIYSQALTFSKAQYLEKTLFVDSLGEGLVSFFGFDLHSLLFDSRSIRKEFYSTLAHRPHEETSVVSKGDITRLLFLLLRYLHTTRALPFVHKWFFPGNAENVFLFRIDSDFGNKKRIEQWFEIGKSNHIRYTWFLHVSAHKEWLKLFHEFNGHEIAVHGYEHFASNSFQNHKQDIQKAYTMLQEEGHRLTGYASPYGLWNQAISEVREHFGFNYSSEFSYLYNSLPMHPVINNKKSAVLQLPIHPVCIGSLLNAKATENEMVNYFIETMHRHMLYQSPIVLYDHVTHNNQDVLIELFMKVQALNIASLPFNEFASWWNKRQAAAFSATIDSANQLRINPIENRSDLYYAVWIDENSYILTKESTVHLKSQTVKHSEEKVLFDSNILKRMRKFNVRMYKHALLNKLFWRNRK